MKTAYQYNLAQNPKADIRRSTFRIPHSHKTTGNAGFLIPIFQAEVLPGDTFRMEGTVFARLSSALVPPMDTLYLDTFWFYIPYRLVWRNWKKFCGEQESPEDSIDYLVPQVVLKAEHREVHQIANYLGIPLPYGTGDKELSVNALPFRCYNLVYNEWFRDQDLMVNVPVNQLSDGPDTPANYQLLKRAKRPDYFTTCRPWPQKGDEVTILAGAGEIPVVGNGQALGLSGGNFLGLTNAEYGKLAAYDPVDDDLVPDSGDGITDPSPWPQNNLFDGKFIGVTRQVDRSGLVAQLSSDVEMTVNKLREAFAMQRFLEKCARGGTRYTEILRTHFGVISSDMRQQRPEFLCATSTVVNFQEIPQTSATEGSQHLGQLGAVGKTGEGSISWIKSFEEHGHILGLVNIRCAVTYQTGLNRMWNRRSRFDYYWPSFANLGEQPVYKRELHLTGTEDYTNPESTGWDSVFGYNGRYDEYRYIPNLITGHFCSRHAQSLDFYHFSEEYGSVPSLGQTFMEDQSDELIERLTHFSKDDIIEGGVVKSHGVAQFLFDFLAEIEATRPMPVYPVPGLIDHF